MPIITDQVDPALLQQPPPRALPPLLLPNLLGEYLIELPLSVYLNPVLLGSIVAALAMIVLNISLPPLWLALALILTVHIGMGVWKISCRIREDMKLIKYGIITRARILRCRLYAGPADRPGGAFLDCAISIGRNRTVVGSVWLADSAEALCLAETGWLPVICLPRVPGTWRLLHPLKSEVYYDLFLEPR